MELDVGRLPDGASLEADLCIIGAGPAGIALAREFIGLGIEVLLLESGGARREEWAQTLNEGTVAGDAYVGLRPSRHRQIGGTTCIWNTPAHRSTGAKYVPLDPWDFEAKRDGLGRGWPIQAAELTPFYRRAQSLARLGPLAYEAQDWVDPAREPFRLAGDLLTSRVYQFGTRQPFTDDYPDQLRAATNVRLCRNATVCRLLPDATGRRVVEARIGSRSGRWQTARAGTFVLAGGAIENPRLLLVSSLGNDMVGRCFMEHPRDHALSLIPATHGLFTQARFYDTHSTSDGPLIGGRLALTGRAVRELDLPNASVTLLPRVVSPDMGRGFVASLVRRVQRWVAPPPRGGYGWSRESEPERVFDGFRLLINLEQRAHPENRIVLGSDTDALGVPRPVLHWRWRSEEQAGLDRLRAVVVSTLEAAGLGRVEVDSGRQPDPNAHHHAGTTRMDPDPAIGVVDSDGRVHDTENLFVTGASVFPSAGFANPTLTILALALRLADHLKGRVSG
jgi:choline dehydrogenase-like flavoprotein